MTLSYACNHCEANLEYLKKLKEKSAARVYVLWGIRLNLNRFKSENGPERVDLNKPRQDKRATGSLERVRPGEGDRKIDWEPRAEDLVSEQAGSSVGESTGALSHGPLVPRQSGRAFPRVHPDHHLSGRHRPGRPGLWHFHQDFSGTSPRHLDTAWEAHKSWQFRLVPRRACQNLQRARWNRILPLYPHERLLAKFHTLNTAKHR